MQGLTNTNTNLNPCTASKTPSTMSTQRAIMSGLSFLLTFTQQTVSAKPATLLPRQLLGNPHDPGEPRPFDPRPGSPLLVDPPRSLSECQDLTIESAVLYASCIFGRDGTATSPSVNLICCIDFVRAYFDHKQTLLLDYRNSLLYWG